MNVSRVRRLSCLAGAAVLVLAWPSAGIARTLSVCMGDRAYPPLFFLDHEGQAQWLVRKAVERQGDQVVFLAVPWRRCLQGLRSGVYEAAIPVVGNTSFLQDFAFPMQGAQLDPDRALAQIRHMVVRRVGEPAGWDGMRFSALHRPVLYPAGIVVVKETLAALGVPADDGSAVEEQALRKLMAGRAQLAVIQAGVAADLLSRPEYAGQLEVLPQPLVSTQSYVAFSRAFHDAAPAYAQAVWQEIRRLRGTPEWRVLAPQLAR